MKVTGTLALLFAASASLVAALPAPATGDSRVFSFNVAERDTPGALVQPRASNVTARATNSTDAAARTVQGLADRGTGGGGALDFLNVLVSRGDKRNPAGKVAEPFKPQSRVDKSEHAVRNFHNGIGNIEGLVKRNTSST